MTQYSREALIASVKDGTLTPDEAQRLADKEKLGSLLRQPDDADFNPMVERSWTLTMAAEWLVTHDVDRVRRCMPRWLRESEVFLPKRAPGAIGFEKGPRSEVGHYPRKLSADEERALEQAAERIFAWCVEGKLALYGMSFEDIGIEENDRPKRQSNCRFSDSREIPRRYFLQHLMFDPMRNEIGRGDKLDWCNVRLFRRELIELEKAPDRESTEGDKRKPFKKDMAKAILIDLGYTGGTLHKSLKNRAMERSKQHLDGGISVRTFCAAAAEITPTTEK